MIQVQYLFDGDDEEGYHNNRVHLGEMAGLLGHPPLEFLRHSVHSSRVFDNEGELLPVCWMTVSTNAPAHIEPREMESESATFA